LARPRPLPHKTTQTASGWVKEKRQAAHIKHPPTHCKHTHAHRYTKSQVKCVDHPPAPAGGRGTLPLAPDKGTLLSAETNFWGVPAALDDGNAASATPCLLLAGTVAVPLLLFEAAVEKKRSGAM